MGYAVVSNREWRAVTPDMPLAPNETYQEIPPVLTDQEKLADKLKEYKVGIRHAMDAIVAAHGYDDLMTAISYTDDDDHPDWKAESKAIKKWRSHTYDVLKVIEDEVAAQKRPAPTLDELISEIPSLVMP